MTAAIEPVDGGYVDGGYGSDWDDDFIAGPGPGIPLVAPSLRPPATSDTIAPASISKNPMYSLLDVHKKSEEQAGRSVKLFGQSIDRDYKELERLSAEKQKALEMHAKSVKARNTWGIFGKVAQYVVSAATIVLGAACIASGVGTGAGALLIASGGLNLMNRVMTDTGAWNAVAAWFTQSEELQAKIGQWIDASLFFVSLGLGLAGGIWAYKAGALSSAAAAGRAAWLQNIGKAIGLAGGAMQVGTRIGEAAANRKVGNIEADGKIRDSQTALTYGDISSSTKELESIIETPKMLGEVIQSGFNNLRFTD